MRTASAMGLLCVALLPLLCSAAMEDDDDEVAVVDEEDAIEETPDEDELPDEENEELHDIGSRESLAGRVGARDRQAEEDAKKKAEERRKERERSRPPPTKTKASKLPDDLKVGDRVYYIKQPQDFPSGDKLRRGMQAEVLGPATDGSHDLQVMFKGHRSQSNIFRHEVSLEKPEDRELSRLGDGSWLPSGFQLAVMEEPAAGKCARPATYGDKAEIQYVGYEAREQVIDGTSVWKKGRKIDETLGRKGQIKVHIGAKKALDGIEKALLGMCPGEKRKATIPPHLAFGGPNEWKKPSEKVLAKPDEATLIYLIRLIELKKGKTRAEEDNTLMYVMAFVALAVCAGGAYAFKARKVDKGKGKKHIPVPKKRK